MNSHNNMTSDNVHNNIINTDGIDIKDKETIMDSVKYTLVIIFISLLVNVAIRLDTRLLKTYLSEESFTEYAQTVCILITLILFLVLAVKRPDLRQAAVLISGFFSVIMIRELDGVFDAVYHGFWLVPALLVTLLSLLYALKDGGSLVRQMANILRAPSMKILICGLMILMVYSRLFGMGSFWNEVMSAHYVREVKIIAEEGTELLAYCLITFGAFLVRKEI